MGQYLFIINDPPSERTYNASRLAGSISIRDDTKVRVFLIGDAVGCAIVDQEITDDFYELDSTLMAVMDRGGEVACCGTCMNDRGITEDMLIDGARPSTLEELTDWSIAADKIITF